MLCGEKSEISEISDYLFQSMPTLVMATDRPADKCERRSTFVCVAYLGSRHERQRKISTLNHHMQ